MENLFNFASSVTKKAAVLILKNYEKVRHISYKKGLPNLVTNVDKEVEALIIKDISLNYPSHSIIAEESPKKIKDKRFKWFIDPIDGTTNFAHGYPFFCTSIAFEKDGVLEFGIVLNPMTGEFYSAKKHKGAKLNGKEISVSTTKKLKESLLITGFSHERKNSKLNNFNNFCKLTQITHGVRRDGAAALDLCLVACGKADGFWEGNLNPWDVASGVLIVKEAGGEITDYRGNEYNIFTDKIVATNKFIHKELIKHLIKEMRASG